MFVVKEALVHFRPAKGGKVVEWEYDYPITDFYESNSYLEAMLKAGQVIGNKYAAIIFLNGKEIQAVWENPITGKIYAASDMQSLLALFANKGRNI